MGDIACEEGVAACCCKVRVSMLVCTVNVGSMLLGIACEEGALYVAWNCLRKA